MFGRSSHWTQWGRVWTPSRDLPGTILECWADDSITLHTTPRSQGTSPPVLTFGGTLTGNVFPYIQCDAAGALGVWTYKVSYNDGATFPHTGILSSGSPTALPGIGSAITVSAAAGNAATNNIWQPLATAARDVTGLGNHPAEATAANCTIARAVAFNGRPCFDFGTAGTFGFTTPSVTIGPFSVFIVARGDASSGYAFVTGTDVAANGGYLVGTDVGATRTSYVSRSSSASSRKDGVTSFMRDGTRRTYAQTFDGTHAGHKLYRNGVDISAATGVESADPGTGTFSAALRIGYSQVKATGFRGLMPGFVVANRAWTAAEVAQLHQYAITSRGFAL